MGFIKEFQTTHSVTAGYSRITKVVFELFSNICRADIQVWSNKSAAEAGAEPLVTKHVTIAADEFKNFVKLLRLREWLHLHMEDGEFSGATLDEEDVFNSVLSMQVSGSTSELVIPVTVVFNRVVTSGEPQLTDFVATNSSLSNLSSDDNITFTMDWTIEEGETATLKLSEASVQDTFDTDNIESNTLSLLHDVVSATISTEEESLTSNTEFSASIGFDREIVNLSLSMLDVAHCTLSNLATEDNITFTFDVEIEEGQIATIQLPVNSVVDASAPAVKNEESNTLSIEHKA